MVELLNVAMICRVQADVAQVVAHLIGSEEVTGPSLVMKGSRVQVPFSAF